MPEVKEDVSARTPGVYLGSRARGFRCFALLRSIVRKHYKAHQVEKLRCTVWEGSTGRVSGVGMEVGINGSKVCVIRPGEVFDCGRFGGVETSVFQTVQVSCLRPALQTFDP